MSDTTRIFWTDQDAAASCPEARWAVFFSTLDVRWVYDSNSAHQVGLR
jgi:hypothetical protein